MLSLHVVDAIGAGAEGDVVFFRRDQGGVEAPVLEVLNYCSGDLACVFVFPEENENHLPMQNVKCVDNQLVTNCVVEMWYTNNHKKLHINCVYLHDALFGKS